MLLLLSITKNDEAEQVFRRVANPSKLESAHRFGVMREWACFLFRYLF